MKVPTFFTHWRARVWVAVVMRRRLDEQGSFISARSRAFSVDYEHRVRGKDWWANEEPTPEEAKAPVDGPLDLLITHDAPAGVPLRRDIELRPEIAERANKARELLRQVVDTLVVPHVFCWHQGRIYELVGKTGEVTHVDVLNMEHSKNGNGVLVWPSSPPLRIEPLHISGAPA